MRVAVDAMGGDRAPAEIVKGVLAALPAFETKIQSKWLRRYSRFVTSADTGAVLQD